MTPRRLSTLAVLAVLLAGAVGTGGAVAPGDGTLPVPNFVEGFFGAQTY